jgi:two-component system response regulator AtoC
LCKVRAKLRHRPDRALRQKGELPYYSDVPKNSHALVIDDEPQVRSLVAEVLRTEGWQVDEVASATEAYDAGNNRAFDLIFCDVVLGKQNGYDVLRRFTEDHPAARFVLMTGHGSAIGALDATAIGAFDYLIKPFDLNEIIKISEQVREQLKRENRSRSEITDDAKGYISDIALIGRSPKFVECLKLVGRVAPSNLSVLVMGESGTGKEIVANVIHRRSQRGDGPFVTVNCGAIPSELIESELFGHVKGSFTGATADRTGMWQEASSGTIFLDEITETDLNFQVKLLRAIQQGEIRKVGANQTTRADVRVIAATNRLIEKQVEDGRFRQDLMYRLNAVTIVLPPLRERIDDIPLLAAHFAEKAAKGGGPPSKFSSEAIDAFKAYHWPGNVRELENAVLRGISLSDGTVYPEHLPPQVLSGKSIQPSNLVSASADVIDVMKPLSLVEYEHVVRVLENTNGNKNAAARILQIDRKTLSRIIERGLSGL